MRVFRSVFVGSLMISAAVSGNLLACAIFPFLIVALAANWNIANWVVLLVGILCTLQAIYGIIAISLNESGELLPGATVNNTDPQNNLRWFSLSGLPLEKGLPAAIGATVAPAITAMISFGLKNQITVNLSQKENRSLSMLLVTFCVLSCFCAAFSAPSLLVNTTYFLFAICQSMQLSFNVSDTAFGIMNLIIVIFGTTMMLALCVFQNAFVLDQAQPPAFLGVPVWLTISDITLLKNWVQAFAIMFVTLIAARVRSQTVAMPTPDENNNNNNTSSASEPTHTPQEQEEGEETREAIITGVKKPRSRHDNNSNNSDDHLSSSDFNDDSSNSNGTNKYSNKGESPNFSDRIDGFVDTVGKLLRQGFALVKYLLFVLPTAPYIAVALTVIYVPSATSLLGIPVTISSLLASPRFVTFVMSIFLIIYTLAFCAQVAVGAITNRQTGSTVPNVLNLIFLHSATDGSRQVEMLVNGFNFMLLCVSLRERSLSVQTLVAEAPKPAHSPEEALKTLGPRRFEAISNFVDDVMMKSSSSAGSDKNKNNNNNAADPSNIDVSSSDIDSNSIRAYVLGQATEFAHSPFAALLMWGRIVVANYNYFISLFAGFIAATFVDHFDIVHAIMFAVVLVYAAIPVVWSRKLWFIFVIACGLITLVTTISNFLKKFDLYNPDDHIPGQTVITWEILGVVPEKDVGETVTALIALFVASAQSFVNYNDFYRPNEVIVAETFMLYEWNRFSTHEVIRTWRTRFTLIAAGVVLLGVPLVAPRSIMALMLLLIFFAVSVMTAYGFSHIVHLITWRLTVVYSALALLFIALYQFEPISDVIQKDFDRSFPQCRNITDPSCLEQVGASEGQNVVLVTILPWAVALVAATAHSDEVIANINAEQAVQDRETARREAEKEQLREEGVTPDELETIQGTREHGVATNSDNGSSNKDDNKNKNNTNPTADEYDISDDEDEDDDFNNTTMNDTSLVDESGNINNNKSDGTKVAERKLVEPEPESPNTKQARQTVEEKKNKKKKKSNEKKKKSIFSASGKAPRARDMALESFPFLDQAALFVLTYIFDLGNRMFQIIATLYREYSRELAMFSMVLVMAYDATLLGLIFGIFLLFGFTGKVPMIYCILRSCIVYCYQFDFIPSDPVEVRGVSIIQLCGFSKQQTFTGSNVTGRLVIVAFFANLVHDSMLRYESDYKRLARFIRKVNRTVGTEAGYELCVLALLVSLSYSANWLGGWLVTIFVIIAGVFFDRERFLPSFWLLSVFRILLTCLFLGIHLVGLLGRNKVVDNETEWTQYFGFGFERSTIISMGFALTLLFAIANSREVFYKRLSALRTVRGFHTFSEWIASQEYAFDDAAELMGHTRETFDEVLPSFKKMLLDAAGAKKAQYFGSSSANKNANNNVSEEFGGGRLQEGQEESHFTRGGGGGATVSHQHLSKKTIRQANEMVPIGQLDPPRHHHRHRHHNNDNNNNNPLQQHGDGNTHKDFTATARPSATAAIENNGETDINNKQNINKNDDDEDAEEGDLRFVYTFDEFRIPTQNFMSTYDDDENNGQQSGGGGGHFGSGGLFDNNNNNNNGRSVVIIEGDATKHNALLDLVDHLKQDIIFLSEKGTELFGFVMGRVALCGFVMLAFSLTGLSFLHIVFVIFGGATVAFHERQNVVAHTYWFKVMLGLYLLLPVFPLVANIPPVATWSLQNSRYARVLALEQVQRPIEFDYAMVIVLFVLLVQKRFVHSFSRAEYLRDAYAAQYRRIRRHARLKALNKARLRIQWTKIYNLERHAERMLAQIRTMASSGGLISAAAGPSTSETKAEFTSASKQADSNVNARDQMTNVDEQDESTRRYFAEYYHPPLDEGATWKEKLAKFILDSFDNLSEYFVRKSYRPAENGTEINQKSRFRRVFFSFLQWFQARTFDICSMCLFINALLSGSVIDCFMYLVWVIVASTVYPRPPLRWIEYGMVYVLAAIGLKLFIICITTLSQPSDSAMRVLSAFFVKVDKQSTSTGTFSDVSDLVWDFLVFAALVLRKEITVNNGVFLQTIASSKQVPGGAANKKNRNSNNSSSDDDSDKDVLDDDDDDSDNNNKSNKKKIDNDNDLLNNTYTQMTRNSNNIGGKRTITASHNNNNRDDADDGQDALATTQYNAGGALSDPLLVSKINKKHDSDRKKKNKQKKKKDDKNSDSSNDGGSNLDSEEESLKDEMEKNDEEEEEEEEGPSMKERLVEFWEKYYSCRKGIGKDSYLLSVSFLWLALIVFILGFYPISGGTGSLVTALQSDLLPGTLVLVISLITLIMIIDRAAYLLVNIYVKAIVHSLYAIIGIIGYVIYRDYHRDANFVGYLFFACCWAYLMVSSAQVKSGFPRQRRHDPFTPFPDSTVRGTFYGIYMAIPFLWEMRTCIDWTFTFTSLSFEEWFKVEDVIQMVYARRVALIERPDRLGEKQKIGAKAVGFIKVLFIAVVLLFPLMNFSTFNPNTVKNSVVQMSLKIQFGQFSPIYDSATFTATSIPVDYKLWLSRVFPGLVSLGVLNSFKSVQLIELTPCSSELWTISPQGLRTLNETLDQVIATNGTIPLQITLQVNREYTSGEAPLEITTPRNKELNVETARQMKQALGSTAGTTSALITNLFNPIQLNQPTSLSPYEPIGLDCNLTLRAPEFNPELNTEVRYWCVSCPTIFSQGNIPNSTFPEWDCLTTGIGCGPFNYESIMYSINNHDTTSLYSVYISDDVANSFGFLAGIGIIAFYTTFVLAVGNALRGMFSNAAHYAVFTEMAHPLHVHTLLQYLELARFARPPDLQTENRVYLQLIDLLRSPETLLRFTGRMLKLYKSNNEVRPEDQFVATLPDDGQQIDSDDEDMNASPEQLHANWDAEFHQEPGVAQPTLNQAPERLVVVPHNENLEENSP